MRPIPRLLPIAGAAALMIITSACSSAGSTASPVGAQATPSTAAANALVVGMATGSSVGTYLTGQSGLTLYVFLADSPDMSACTTSACLSKWAPALVSNGGAITGPTGATGTFATTARSDGGMQVTYNHQPLYYYLGDVSAGDTNGQGLNNKWYVAPLNGTYSGPGATSSAAVGGY